jgi:hypothetical protein
MRWHQLCATAILCVAASAVCAQTPQFIDWTSVDSGNRTASGTLGTTPVTLTWTTTGLVPTALLNGEYTGFSGAAFTPGLAESDALEIVGRVVSQSVPTYTISFGVPVRNPVLHIASNASVLDFSGGLPQRVSGDQRFTVIGSQVRGSDFNDPNGTDANGTVRFNGLISSLSFTAQYVGPAPTGADGITITVGAAEGLTLVGLEVVQAVQDWKNSAALAAGKATVIRAHLEDPNVPAQFIHRFRIRGYGGPGLNQPLDPPDIQNGPPPLRAGEVLTLPQDADLASRALPGVSATFFLPPTWLAPGPKRFDLEPVSTVLGTCGDKAPPTNDDCSVTVDFRAQESMVVNLLRAHLAPTGSLPRPDELSAVCTSIRDRLPTSSVTCVVDPDPLSFAVSDPPDSEDVLVAAERRKVFFRGCLWPWCKEFYLAVTTFKTNGTGVGMANFPDDAGVFARSAWAVVPVIDGTAAAHEVGHNLGLQHPTLRDLVAGDLRKDGSCGEVADLNHTYPPSDSFYFPYYSGDAPLLGPLGDEHFVVLGYEYSALRAVQHDEKALMSYAGPFASTIACRTWRDSWPDIGSHNFVAAQLASTTIPELAAPAASNAPYFLISGRVDVASNVAEIDPVESLVPGFVPPVPPAGDWDLLAHYASGPDVAHPVALSYSPNDPALATWTVLIPGDDQIIGFSLRRQGAVIAQAARSPNAPTVVITAPVPGSMLIGATLTLAWQAADPDGDPLSYAIDYSPDNGATWSTLSTNWPASPFEIRSEDLQPSDQGLFRVTARDGFRSSSATLAGSIRIVRNVLLLDGFE